MGPIKRGAVIALATIIAACAHTDEPAASPRPEASQSAAVKKPDQTPSISAGDAQVLNAFLKRVEAYVELHKRLEGKLPRLPKETTPQVVDQHQRSLAKLIAADRQAARRGDIFGADAERIFKAHLARIFGGADGRALKASIMDENPVGVMKLTVNGRYPDEVPLSTVPPQVLAVLPKLPEELEYRFVGDHLILLDVHAHIIVDFIEKALP